jgi:hypothetical protein
MARDESPSCARTHARTRRRRQYPATGWGSRAPRARHSSTLSPARLSLRDLLESRQTPIASEEGWVGARRARGASPRAGQRSRDSGPDGWMDGYIVLRSQTAARRVAARGGCTSSNTACVVGKRIGIARLSRYGRAARGDERRDAMGCDVGAESSKRGCMHWRRAWWRARRG